MALKTHETHSTAKAIIALLILLIAYVIFNKFITNQEYFFDDIEALRNYTLFAIVGGGFLIGLLYLVGNSSQKATSKSSKAKKKKK